MVKQSRSHTVGGQGRGEGKIWEPNEGGTKSFGEIARKQPPVQGIDGYGRQNREGIRYVEGPYVMYGEQVTITEIFEVSIQGENGAPCRKGYVITNGERKNKYAPPFHLAGKLGALRPGFEGM